MERLKGLNDKTLLWDAFLPCVDARNALMSLLIDPVSLQVCRPAAEKLLHYILAVLPTPGEEPDPNKPIGYGATEITSTVADFSIVLDAECRTLDTYAVSRKGAYSMPIPALSRC